MYLYTISVNDGHCISHRDFESKSGYFSIEDIMAIVAANTDLRRILPAEEMGRRQSRRTTKQKVPLVKSSKR